MSPYVSEGVRTLSTDGYYTWEDGKNELRERVTYDHHLTRHVMLRARTVFEDNNHDRFGYKSSELGAKFSFTAPGELPLDLGLYAGLIVQEENSEETLLNLRFSAGKRIGNWQHHGEFLLTPSFQKQFDKSKTQFRFSSRYAWDKQWKLGGEYFGTFGTLDNATPFNKSKHQAGPFVKYSTKDEAFFTKLSFLAPFNSHTENAKLKWQFGTQF